MQTHISPLGYDSTRVTRPLLSTGLAANDRVVLLRPEIEQNDRRADEALQDVERVLGELEPSIVVDRITIRHTEFQQAVLDCLAVITESEGEVVVNFGGGARDVFLPLTVAVLSRLDAITTILQFSDIDGGVTEVSFPDLTADVSATGRATLSTLRELDGGATVPELTAAIDRSKSTILRHIEQLEQYGAVETERHGKTKYVQLQFTGTVLLETRS